MADWQKVNLTKAPFFYSEEQSDYSVVIDESDYLTEEYAAVFHKAIQKELGGKDLKYLWSEEGYDEPGYLANFNRNGWNTVFCIHAQYCSHFGYVTLEKGPPINGVRWAIHFEQLAPIWIKEY